MGLKIIGKIIIGIFFVLLGLSSCSLNVREKSDKDGFEMATDTIEGHRQLNAIVVNMNKAIKEIDSTMEKIKYRKDMVETSEGDKIETLRQALNDQRQKLSDQVKKINDYTNNDWNSIKEESDKMFDEAKAKIKEIEDQLDKLDSK